MLDCEKLCRRTKRGAENNMQAAVSELILAFLSFCTVEE